MSPTAAPHGPLPKIPQGLKKIRLGALVFDEVDLLDVGAHYLLTLEATWSHTARFYSHRLFPLAIKYHIGHGSHAHFWRRSQHP